MAPSVFRQQPHLEQQQQHVSCLSPPCRTKADDCDDSISVASTSASSWLLPSFMSWDCDDDDENASGPSIALHGSSSSSLDASSCHTAPTFDRSRHRCDGSDGVFDDEHSDEKSDTVRGVSRLRKSQSLVPVSPNPSTVSRRSSGGVFAPPSANAKLKRLNLETEIRTARHALVGSTRALLNLLQQSGVPKPSVAELQRNLDEKRYFAVLERCQDYTHCLVVQIVTDRKNKVDLPVGGRSDRNECSSSSSDSVDSALAKTHLMICAWESLCRFKRTQYRIAYKRCFRLRYETPSSDDATVRKAIAMQVLMAEQAAACQKKYYLAKRWQHAVQRHLNAESERAVSHVRAATRCLQ